MGRRMFMYVNDRGQMNFHDFVKSSRELTEANLKKAAEGVCTESEWSRFEIGDRLPEKLMRDRMVARLGISGEEYEEYLRPEEYMQWEIRMFILRQLNMGNLSEAARGVRDYEKIPKQNCVQRQFTDTMRYMIASMQGVPSETLSMMIELAVAHTVASIEYAFRGTQLLADQELNLIAEYAKSYNYEGDNIREWRFDLYKKILNYIDHSTMDRISRAKVYPKVTCQICELLLESESTEGEIRYAYEMCSKSVELLRDTSRLYYFVELMEYRKRLIEHIREYEDVAAEEKENLKLVYDKDSEWENVLKEFYEAYDLPVYMQNFTYLYVETECESVVEIIQTRRNMFKLSRVRVSENICTDKTIERFEKYMNSPTIVVVRDIFDRIGLCGEYRRAKIISEKAELLELNNILTTYLNNNELDKAQKCLEELESQLDMEICYNKQEIKKSANLIAIRKGELDGDTLYKRALEALECSIPFEHVVRKPEKYFTRSEVECLYDLAFKVKGKLSDTCYEILLELCEKELSKTFNAMRLAMLEPIMVGLARKWNCEEKYRESYDYSERLMKECLSHYRSVALVDCQYNKGLVYEKLSAPYNIPSREPLIKKSLEDCVVLAEIAKKSNWTAFLQTKLSDYISD